MSSRNLYAMLHFQAGGGGGGGILSKGTNQGRIGVLPSMGT